MSLYVVLLEGYAAVHERHHIVERRHVQLADVVDVARVIAWPRLQRPVAARGKNHGVQHVTHCWHPLVNGRLLRLFFSDVCRFATKSDCTCGTFRSRNNYVGLWVLG